MKKLFFILMFFSVLFAKDITFNGYISKVVFNKKYLVAGLENGDIYVKNFKTLKLVKKIILPKIHNVMGDIMPMPIYSLDIWGNNILILAEGEEASRELFIYNLKKQKLTHLWTSSKTYMRVKYINKNQVLFGLLSDEIALYDLKTKKFIYDVQVGNYVFSTFILNKNKTKVAVGDESGAVTILDVKTGKTLDKFSNFNKNQTISLDFRKNLVINGSSDMRVSVTNINTNTPIVEMKVKFLPYGVAISPNLKYFAVQYNENNDIAIFDMNKNLIKFIKGQNMPLNDMKFISNKVLFNFSADKIMIVNIDKK